jgi:menaquinol-cytochrome c reductase iron-sulfur subunit
MSLAFICSAETPVSADTHAPATRGVQVGCARLLSSASMGDTHRNRMNDTRPCADCPSSARQRQGVPSPDRRRFLTKISLAMAGIAAVLAGLPFVGFLFSPVIERQRQAWRTVGGVEDFPIGDTRMVTYLDPEPLPWAGFAGYSAAWVRRDRGEDFTVFSMYCTHTGCPVTWSAGAQLFLCPCHGGSFHPDGRVAGGPPPNPLERLPVRVRDGQVELRTIGAPRAG